MGWQPGGMNNPRIATRLASASALLFSILVVMQLASGAAQHWFELVHPPDAYARRLIAQAGWLRAVIAADDLFIACYVGATVFAVLALPRSWISGLVAAGGLATGLVDVVENHHMLALLRAAESGMIPAPADLVHRMTDSSVKWVIGHLTFFFFAFLIRGRALPARLARAALFAQLPLGIAGVVFDQVLSLQLVLAANLFVGFVLIAVLCARAAAAGTGAPASPPGTTPGAAA
jgi:hypothetical protein